MVLDGLRQFWHTFWTNEPRTWPRKRISRGDDVLLPSDVEYRTNCFFSFLLFFKEATIRRTAYVQRTNGSSCTCVEYLTGLSPIHNTCWIALNEEAAARSSSPSKMNRGDRGSIFNHTQPLSLYDHSSDCRSTIWIQRKFAGNSIDFLFSWYY